ncbi:MAG TPA: minor capsid protein, partial [Candidatus Mediterraneibacter stercorigallinarum]|nr:minor capsid protein [Candidatus Mediterraneibacter stercorigallinarum]
MAEAKKRAAKLDIEAYGRKAAKYVKEKNFSKQANEEMRLYNLTMKVNRLELLKAQIGLEMVSGFDELQKYYEEILTDRAVSEFERQAGILGKTIQNNAKAANAIVNASFHNATFSDRIWMYQDMLKNELSSLLQTGLIRGENPRRLATHLRKRFGVSQGNAERLMITELARVQTEAQKQSFERNGFEEYTFLALGDACPICKALDGKHFKVKKMMPGTNASPMHPRCRCSVAAYEDSEDYGDWLDFLDKGGTTEEWNELKKQRNSKEYSALKTKKEAADYLKNVLGVNSVNLKGLTVDEINEINKSLRNIYQEYPQLQFFIQKVKTSISGGHTAAFVSKYDAGKITTEILVNPTDFKNIKKVVDRSVKAGYWTPKEGIEGVMRHETGHALEMYLTFSERGVNPFDTQPNGLVDRYQAMKASMAGEYSKKVVSKAF